MPASRRYRIRADYYTENGNARHDTTRPAPLTAWRSVVVISDWIEGEPGGGPFDDRYDDPPFDGTSTGGVEVAGGYPDRPTAGTGRGGRGRSRRDPHRWRGQGTPPFRREQPALARRAFRIDDETAPFRSAAMLDLVTKHGAPHLPVVLGYPACRARTLDLAARYCPIVADYCRVA